MSGAIIYSDYNFSEIVYCGNPLQWSMNPYYLNRNRPLRKLSTVEGRERLCYLFLE